MSVNELGAQSTNDPRSLIGSVFNITNNTNPNGPLIIQSTSITNTASVSSPSISPNQRSGINWLQVCRTPIVDMAIAEPCESLTTPGGYSLTPEGNGPRMRPRCRYPFGLQSNRSNSRRSPSNSEKDRNMWLVQLLV